MLLRQRRQIHDAASRLFRAAAVAIRRQMATLDDATMPLLSFQR